MPPKKIRKSIKRVKKISGGDGEKEVSTVKNFTSTRNPSPVPTASGTAANATTNNTNNAIGSSPRSSEALYAPKKSSASRLLTVPAAAVSAAQTAVSREDCAGDQRGPDIVRRPGIDVRRGKAGRRAGGRTESVAALHVVDGAVRFGAHGWICVAAELRQDHGIVAAFADDADVHWCVPGVDGRRHQNGDFRSAGVVPDQPRARAARGDAVAPHDRGAKCAEGCGGADGGVIRRGNGDMAAGDHAGDHA